MNFDIVTKNFKAGDKFHIYPGWSRKPILIHVLGTCPSAYDDSDVVIYKWWVRHKKRWGHECILDYVLNWDKWSEEDRRKKKK
jgi:hypothetical protein